MQTKNGIVYDLRSSPFMAEYSNLEFYFSSAIHRDKFVSKIQIRIEWLNDSMSRRFHVDLKLDILAVLQLYIQVETRGFLIRDTARSRWFRCLQNLTLDGLVINAQD